MSLRDIFDEAKEQREKTTGHFFATRVLPVVKTLIDLINEDPALGVSVKLDGENGGFLIPLGESQHFWAFEFQFHNKSDGSPAGTAPLRLRDTDPEIAIYAGRLGRGNDMHLSREADMNAVIEAMVRQAACSAADRAGFDAAASVLQSPRDSQNAAGRPPSGVHRWNRTIC